LHFILNIFATQNLQQQFPMTEAAEASGLASDAPLTFDDIVSLQSTSSVYKMLSHSGDSAFALKCVAANGGTKSLEREWDVLLHLRGVKNITEAFALRKDVATTEDIFPVEDRSKTVLVQRFFKAAPVHKLFSMFSHLDEAIVRRTIAQVIIILNDIHLRGVVYVDLKLPNILLAKDGVVKLVDFGSSVVLAQHQLDGREADGCQFPREPFLHGTVHVRAPELFGDGLWISNPTMLDVWALGVCTFEMLCGHPLPVDAASCRHASQPCISWPNHVSVEAREFVDGLLRVEATDRLGFEGGVVRILKHPFLAGFCAGDDSTLPEEYEEEVDMQTLGL
jgi:serine/threonine protein kinase